MAKFPGANNLILAGQRGMTVKHLGLEPDWVDYYLTPLFTYCVALDKLLYLSVPLWFHL